MALETTGTSGVDKTTQMANILMGIDETALETPKPAVKKPLNPVTEYENDTDDQELDEDSTLTDDSIEDQDIENEEEPEEVEQEEEAETNEDADLTWGKVLGVDEKNVVLDDDGNFKGFKTKVDGVEAIIPTKDLIAGWQSNRSNTNKSKAIAEDRREFEQVRDAVVNVYTKKLDDVAKLQNIMEQNLMKEFHNVNWEQLRHSDPAEYAASVQDFQIRQAEVANITNAIETERAKELEQITLSQKEAMSNYLQEQTSKVLENNPEWAKPEVFQKNFSKIETLLVNTYGFSKDEIAQIQDARIFEVLKDAMKYREGKTVAEKKITIPVAKYMKQTGVVKKPQPSKLDRLTKLAKAEKPGPRKRDLESTAIAELLMGR